MHCSFIDRAEQEGADVDRPRKAAHGHIPTRLSSVSTPPVAWLFLSDRTTSRSTAAYNLWQRSVRRESNPSQGASPKE